MRVAVFTVSTLLVACDAPDRSTHDVLEDAYAREATILCACPETDLGTTEACEAAYVGSIGGREEECLDLLDASLDVDAEAYVACRIAVELAFVDCLRTIPCSDDGTLDPQRADCEVVLFESIDACHGDAAESAIEAICGAP